MELLVDSTNVLCFYTDNSVVDVHYHSCYQLVVSTKHPYDSLIDGQHYHNLRGFLIDKYVRHACAAPVGSFLVYYVESRSYLGKQFQLLLRGQPFLDLAMVLPAQRLDALQRDFAADELNTADLRALSDRLLADIFQARLASVAPVLPDGRIEKAVAYIDAHLSGHITLADVAGHIFLSPERTRHLFLEQLDVPFSQYVLWKRIKAVLAAVLRERQSLFEAALRYGFTDQSHFSRFFKRMFGIPATLILQNSRFVQFIYPEL